jgi:hypothetical protein
LFDNANINNEDLRLETTETYAPMKTRVDHKTYFKTHSQYYINYNIGAFLFPNFDLILEASVRK